MNKSLIVVLGVFALVLSACGGLGSITQNTQSTLAAQESTRNTREADLVAQINALQTQLDELQSKVTNLTAEKDAALVKANNAAADKNSAERTASSFKSLFTYEKGDSEGEYIFCEDAFSTSFAYVDKVSMRKELIKYLAKKKGLNPDFISSEHNLMWSNVSDGLLKLQGGGYMYPYFVSFEDSDFGRPDYVFDLTYSCYLDFPMLERLFNNIK
jgi:hypothetical protein